MTGAAVGAELISGPAPTSSLILPSHYQLAINFVA